MPHISVAGLTLALCGGMQALLTVCITPSVPIQHFRGQMLIPRKKLGAHMTPDHELSQAAGLCRV